MATTKRLGELLKDDGLITEQKIQVAIKQQKVTGDLLGTTFMKLGFVSSAEIARALSRQADLPYLNLYEYPISEQALRLVPKETAERLEFMPVDLKDKRLSIGVLNPTNIHAMDAATQIAGIPPEVAIVDADAFYDLIDRAYFFMDNPIEARLNKAVEALHESSSVTAEQVSNLTELILMDGIRRNATDIHITPEQEAVHVFYRIDGVLQHGLCFSKGAQGGVVSKIKVMSELNIAEQRLPQDGSFSFSFLNKNFDMRVSTVPTIYGENVVIRILAGTARLARLSTLGFSPTDGQRLQALFHKPYGIILITGPTGSGKTTTLYAALREINLIERNVLTVEDPVEYRLSLAKQTEVNQKAGYDFALAGRNFMRQDPDVILLGEIRDEETAKIAIRASITGHLVLSTLHTNDAVTTIPRLLDFGVDRFLLASSLLAIISQRLVRRICPHCREPYELTADDRLQLEMAGIHEKIRSAHLGAGCGRCNGTGYSGRTLVDELMIIDDEIRDLIASSASIQNIKEVAGRKGMRFLRQDGVRKVEEAVTSVQEILRVLG